MKKIALSEEGLETVYGARDANLKHIESLLHVEIRTQGGEITIEGDPKDELKAQQIFKQLQELRDEGYPLANGDVKTAAQLLVENADLDLRDYFLKGGQRPVTRRRVTPKSVNQRKYLDAIDQFDIVFGVGPAGTGKTYLAMAQAVTYLLEKKVSRLILARPAVVTGDITQIDLPSGHMLSGLVQALEIVKNIDGIGFIYFDERDVVRHKLVQQIVKAYDAFTNKG